MGLRRVVEADKFSYNQLMLHGVHVGHSFINSIFYTSWLVYSYSQKILILNLYKSLKGMKSGLASIIGAVGSYQPTWFINLDQAAGVPVRFLAMSCGEFSATSFWINGFISNYNSVFNTYRKLRKMSWFSYPTRNKNAKDIYNLWFLTRCTWPRTIFISNVCHSYQPAKESLHLGVPCIGIVDSNTYTHVVSVPVPGNDDSLDCLVFYNEFISKFILVRKYALVISWYYTIRKKSRLFTFKEWLKTKIKLNQKISNEAKVFKSTFALDLISRFNYLKNIKLGMRTLFCVNTKHSLKDFEYLDIFSKSIPENQISSDLYISWKKTTLSFLELISPYLKDLCAIFLNKRLWAIYKAVRARFMKGSYLKSDILSHNYINSNIKFDRFYKTHIRWSYIRRGVIPKFYKFFLFYNLSRFKQLTRTFMPINLFNSVYFKLVWDQLFPQNTPFNVRLKKGHINLNKEVFTSFTIKNLYKLHNLPIKKEFLNNLFRLFKIRNWLRKPIWFKKRHYTRLRVLNIVKHFRSVLNLSNAKVLKKFLAFIHRFLNFYKEYYPAQYCFFTLRVLNEFKIIKKLSYRSSVRKLSWRLQKKLYNQEVRTLFPNYYKRKFSFPLYFSRFKSIFLKRLINSFVPLKDTTYFINNIYKKFHWVKIKRKYNKNNKFNFNKSNKFNFNKYNKSNINIINKSNNFNKNIINKSNESNKNIKKRTINNFILKKKFINKSTNKFYFKKFVVKKIFNEKFLNKPYSLNILKYKSFHNILKKKGLNRLYFIKKISKGLKLYFNNNSILNILSKFKINLDSVIWPSVKNLLFIFLNIFYKNTQIIFTKLFSKNLVTFLFVLLKKIINIIPHKNLVKILPKKFFYYKNTRYNFNDFNFLNRPSSLYINYYYYFYLKKNPFPKKSTDYKNYVKYNNFLIWRNNLYCNSLNWKFFISNSQKTFSNFYRDLFLHWKYRAKFNKTINSINKIITPNNSYRYYLGWHSFRKPVSPKRWFFLKEFFTFPSWFFNFKKNKFTWSKHARKVDVNDVNLDRSFARKYIKYKSLLTSCAFYARKDFDRFGLFISFFKALCHPFLYIKYKKRLLKFITIKLLQKASLKVKDDLLYSLRYNRFLRWHNKQHLLEILTDTINYTISPRQRIVLLKRVWVQPHYDSFYRCVKVAELSLDYAEANERLSLAEPIFSPMIPLIEIEDVVTPEFLAKRRHIKAERSRKFKLFAPVRYKWNYFKSLYTVFLSSKFHNSITPLFPLLKKIYNTPNLKNQGTLNFFLNSYNIFIRPRKLRRRRRIRSRKVRLLKNKRRKFFLQSVVPCHNSKINIKKFCKMYGYRWF